jgi:L-rhamnose mutarotase
MSNENQISLGSIIGLKKEFEEQYILLHKHTFPGVLNRISLSNITDYSIFLHSGILFSHMVYNGTNYDSDMAAIGTDISTREWWKLTDTMQQPLEYRKDNEWWAGINLWFSFQSLIPTTTTIIRHAYTLPVFPGLEETVPNDHFGDIDFWGSTYGLKNLRIFKGANDVYIYLETLKDSDHSFLLEIIARVLKTDKAPIEMTEVFHTENSISISG